MQTKPNDLLATLIFQPDLSMDDLYTVGITPDNTSLKDKDYYKSLQPVKDVFLDKDGNFDESKFDSVYDTAALFYNDWANKIAVGDIIKNYKYDPFDWRQVDKEKVDVSPAMGFDKNPMRDALNIKAMNLITPSDWSIREIAQTEKVFNTETNQFEDWTPNDKGGLWKGIFARPTLVLATYDEDIDLPDETGRIIHHKKGEYKYHPITGKPFYETLGNREIYDKDVLHISDTLTKEGTTINKFDCFDSDSLDKSVGGTVAKMTATIAPALLGAFFTPVGLVYGGLSAGIALSQLMPTLGKAINGFFVNDNQNTQIGKTLNKAEAWAARFARSTTDKSRERFVTVENAASLITDISMQLFQQRAIQYIPRLFKNNPKIYNNAELARTLSYAYMSGTSALESYSAFKQAGADDRIAGLGMFATIGAFYKLMSLDYFRDSFFKGSWFDDNNVKSPVWKVAEDFMSAIKKEGSEIGKEVAKNTVSGNKATLTQLIKRFSDAFEGVGKPWVASTFWERSVAEGAEEVMEETFQDTIKVLFKGAEALGIPMNKERERLDFGFSSKDFFQRYMMSFVGGLAGGAIFQGYNSLSNIGAKVTANTPDAHLSELVKLIADGKSQEIKDIIDKWHTQKRFGSNDLSATKLATVNNVNGETVVAKESTTDDISQNDFIYKALLEQVNYVDRVLSEEGFKNALNDYQKNLETKFPNIDKSILTANLAQKLGLHSLVLKDLNRLGEKIVKLRGQIDSRQSEIAPNGDTKEAKEERDKRLKTDTVLKDLNDALDVLRKQRDAIKNGDRTAYYVSQYKLLLNGTPLQPFLGFGNINSFIRARYGKERYELSETQFELAKEEYEKYKNGDKADTFEAIDIYNAFSEEFADGINQAEKSLANAIADSDLQTTIIGNTYFEFIKNKEEAERKIKELEDKENRTEEETKEIESLKNKISDYNKQINSIRKNPARALYNTTSNVNSLVEKLQQLINQPQVGLEILSEVANEIKESYKQWSTSNTLKRSQSELDSLYFLIKRNSLNKDARWNNISNWLNNYVANSFDPTYETVDDGLRRIITGKENLSEDELIAFESSDGFNTDMFLNWDDRTKLPSHERFESLLTKFYEDLGGDEATVLKDYEEIINFLKEQGLSNDEIQSLLYSDTGNGSLIPIFGNQTLPEFLQEIQQLKANVKNSVLPELLSTIVTKLNDTDSATIFEMIDNEQKRVSSKKDLDDYTMDDIHEAGLTQALYLLNAIKGLLVGASNGTNSEINKWKTGKKFAEISKDVAALIGDDIDEYINRISFLLKLNAMNKGMKLSEHKAIAINMRVKFLEKLTDAIHSEPFKDLFRKGDNFVDPKQIWEDVYKPIGFENINADNYSEFEPVIIAYETELFNRVKALGFSDEEIVDKIMSIFGEGTDIWKQLSSKLNKDDSTVITDFDFAIYLLSILTLNANDFYTKLATKVSDFDKAPLYGHEYIVRTAYAMFANTKAYNRLLDKIQNAYKGSNEYIKSRKCIHNILFGFGGAGTGKSTSVAKLFKALTSDLNTHYVYLASDDNQVKILTESVGAENSEPRLTYKQFFDKTSGDQFKAENVLVNNGIIKLAKQLTYTDYTDILDSSAENTIFICDEIETLNELQLQLLSMYAKDKGIFILGLGDYKQPTGKIIATDDKGVVNTYNSGFEDLTILRTPSLTASLRTLSLAKNDNYNKLDLLVDTVVTKVWEEPETYTDPKILNKFVQDYTKSGYKLDYYVNGNRMVGDRILTDEKEFKSNLETAINIGGNTRTLIVVNNNTISKYQADKYRNNSNVVIASIDQALGGEFDYVFVDVDFNESDLFGELQKFYMLTQRSRLYTAVLDVKNNYSGYLNITSRENEQSNVILSISQSNISDFKEWRLKGLSGLKASEESEQNLKPKQYTAKQTPTTTVENPTEQSSSDEISEETSEETSNESNNENNSESETQEEQSNNSEQVSNSKQTFIPNKPSGTNVPIGPSTSVQGSSNVSTLFNDTSEKDETRDFVTAFVPNISPSNVRFDEYFNEIYKSNFIDKEESENSIFNLIKNENHIPTLRAKYSDFISTIHTLTFESENLTNATEAIKRLCDNSYRLFGIKTNAFKEYLNSPKGTKEIIFKRNTKDSDIFLRFYKSSDAYVDVFIGKSSITRNGKYTGWFTKVSTTSFEKGERITLASLKAKYPGLHIISSGAALIGDEVSQFTGSENFAKWNNGKAFFAAGEIYDNPNPDLIFRESESQGKIWTYSQSDRLTLAAFQKNLSPDDVCKFLVCWDYIKWTHIDKAFTGDVKRKYIETERLANLRKYGFVLPDGKSIDISDVYSTMSKLTGNDAWKNWDTLTDEQRNDLLNKDGYIATPATMSTLFAKILNDIIKNPNQYSESNLWYNLRRELCTNIGTRRLWIKTKDNNVYQLVAVDEPVSDNRGNKLFSKSWKLLTENGQTIISKPYSGNVGISFGNMLNEMFTSAGIDLNTSKVLILRRIEKDGTEYWNVHNTNQVLFDFLSPFIINDSKVQQLFKDFPNGFYANINSDIHASAGPWKLISLEGKEHIYTTDASIWHYSTYSINEDELLSEDTSLQKLDLLNDWKDTRDEIINVAKKIVDQTVLKQITSWYEVENVFDDITSKSLDQHIRDFINTINNHIIANTTNKQTRIIEYDEFTNSAKLVSRFTKNEAINNALEKEGFNLSNTIALYDGLRSNVDTNDISIFNDGNTSVIVYFDEEGNVISKLTGTGQQLSEILLNINNLIPITTVGLTEQATEELNRQQLKDRVTVNEYLIHFAKNQVNVNEANKIVEIMKKYENLNKAICSYLENRLNSDLDEC